MLSNALDVMRYVRTNAGRANLGVVFENKNQPRHDGRTIYLPKISEETTEEQLLEMMSSTDHEVCHELYSDFELLKTKKMKANSLIGYVWNLLEDSRVNVIEARLYEGFREIWDKTTPKLIENMRAKFKEDPSGAGDLIGSLIRWDTGVCRELFPMSAVVGDMFPKNPTIDAVLESFSDRLRTCQDIIEKKAGSESTYVLAEDILKALGKEVSEEEKEKILTDGEAKEEEEPAEESEEEDKTKEKKKAKKGSTADKPGDKKGKERTKEDEWKIVVVRAKDINLDEVVITPLLSEDMGKVGLNVTDLKSPMGSWLMMSEDDLVLVDYQAGVTSNSAFSMSEFTSRKVADDFIKNFDTRVKPHVVTSENFALQVQRLIQIRARVQYERGVKCGQLDYSRLARLAIKQPGYSDRVFKNKIPNNTLNAAVQIILDMSGSMRGDKALYAAQSALLLSRVFHNIRVPYEIFGFTDFHDYRGARESCVTIHYLYKSFAKNAVAEEDLLKYIGQSSGQMSGNPDGDCILWGYNRILKRKEKRRLMIVMSDGSPCAARSSMGLDQFTTKVIKEIEGQKKVEIYGLGLCSHAVKGFYKANSVTESPADIPTKLLELIEQKLLT